MNNLSFEQTLPDYWVAACALPFKKIELPHPRNCLTRYLSQVERATIRVTVDPLEDLSVEHSILGEAVVRLALFEHRGLLKYMSGHHLAGVLHDAFYYPYPSRLAKRGWTLMAALDAADIGAVITISAEPLDSGTSFRRMRISQRLEEIAALPPEAIRHLRHPR